MTIRGPSWQRAMVIVIALTFLAGPGATDDSSPSTPQPVDELDLDRYTGLWYEIARLPNKFQRKCARDVTAHYARLDERRIEVVNSCTREDGQRIASSGVARLAHRGGPAAKLEVRFAPGWLSWLPWVWADYWILEVGPAYEYALVGTPNREYLWVLSREPDLGPAAWEHLLGVAQEQGYDVDQLVVTPQTSADDDLD